MLLAQRRVTPILQRGSCYVVLSFQEHVPRPPPAWASQFCLVWGCSHGRPYVLCLARPPQLPAVHQPFNCPTLSFPRRLHHASPAAAL